MNLRSQEVWITTRLEAIGLPDRNADSRYTPVDPRQRPCVSSGKPGGEENGHSSPIRAQDGRVLYRLSPMVWGWVCRAMRSAETAVQHGRASAADYEELVSRFERLRRWMTLAFPADEIESAVANPQPLPGLTADSADLLPGEAPPEPPVPDDPAEPVRTAQTTEYEDDVYEATVQRARWRIIHDPPDFSGADGPFGMVLDVFGAIHIAEPDFVAWWKNHSRSVAEYHAKKEQQAGRSRKAKA